MKTTEHYLLSGYPNVPPVSRDVYPAKSRIGDIVFITGEDDKKVININKELVEKKLGLELNSGPEVFEPAFSIGMVDHMLQAEHALAEAENQVTDLLKDMPFIPTNFAFEPIIAPGEVFDDPITVYKSKLISGVILTKIVGENNKWVIMKDGIKQTYNFICERVARCVFYALEIPVNEEEPEVIVD